MSKTSELKPLLHHFIDVYLDGVKINVYIDHSAEASMLIYTIKININCHTIKVTISNEWV